MHIYMYSFYYLDIYCHVTFAEGLSSCQGGFSSEAPLYMLYENISYKYWGATVICIHTDTHIVFP